MTAEPRLQRDRADARVATEQPPIAPARPRTPRGTARTDGTRHSIRVTSRLTSIELDTLRMWERRYGFPKPERSAGGSRVYSTSDVEALKLIRRALELGYRAGEVVGKTVEDLADLVAIAAQTAPLRPSQTPTVAALLDALARDDLAAVRSELRQAAALLGPRRFVMEIAHPASVRVGELWADNKLEVHHEHAFSACLSTQLRLALSGFDDVIGVPSVLLAALPGEMHGLGLEMIALMLAASGVTPRLVGVDTPPEQIVAAVRAYGCDAVGIAVMPPVDRAEVSAQLRWMLERLPRRVPLWAGGQGATELELELDGLLLIPDWASLDEAIAALRA